MGIEIQLGIGKGVEMFTVVFAFCIASWLMALPHLLVVIGALESESHVKFELYKFILPTLLTLLCFIV